MITKPQETRDVSRDLADAPGPVGCSLVRGETGDQISVADVLVLHWHARL